ncbi:MAG: carbamoyltransferase HypF [Candidatus Kariarchaeaceae archaeon]
MSSNIFSCKVQCLGIVQGVGFRPLVFNYAIKRDLNGTVQNMGDAGVEIVLQGTRGNIELFIEDLKAKPPLLARIEDLKTEWLSSEETFSDFSIIKSSETRSNKASYVPPDIAMCDLCVEEMLSDHPRRGNYPFTSCVDCGPRYTVIERLPYDRHTTTMIDFPFCPECLEEYQEPANRRFHAQATCCNLCGPHYQLYNKKGRIVETSENLPEMVSKLIKEGSIVAIKGIGGTHIAASVMRSKQILRLREGKRGRKYKPFAVMSRSLEKIRTFAQITDEEEELLNSFRRPIVLLTKKEPFPLSEWVAPGLHNVGVMLPYSGLHYQILDRINDPAIIMTSANPSDFPMFIENDAIINHLKYFVDYFVLHDRRIFQRADDTVIRTHDFNSSSPRFIRRSRGYTPEPIFAHEGMNNELQILGTGAEMHATLAMLKDNKIFQSQHIGNIYNLESLNFWDETRRHFEQLIGITSYDAIGHDLHPSFLTTKRVHEIAEEQSTTLITVQHHHAHMASLMLDNRLSLEERGVFLTLDGLGYGEDGDFWGGEILVGGYDGFQRRGHLPRLPLIGGDQATRYPARLVATAFNEIVDQEELLDYFNTLDITIFPHGQMEKELIVRQAFDNSFIDKTAKSTSLGRVLDISSFLLKVTSERTYEGEPAIRLESVAHKSKGSVKTQLINLEWSNSSKTAILNPKPIYYKLWDERNDLTPKKQAHLANVIQQSLALAYAKKAVEIAQNEKMEYVGLTGGVAYNSIISQIIKWHVEKEGIKFLEHKNIPPGDGGIASGQAVVTSAKINN